MNEKRYQKNKARIDHILASLPQIEKDFDSFQSGSEGARKYFVNMCVDLARLAKFRIQIREIGDTGDFEDESVEKALSLSDRVMSVCLEKIILSYKLMKVYEGEEKEDTWEPWYKILEEKEGDTNDDS